MSSSKPISSKLIESDSKSSEFENVEEYEDDLEDREPDKSGGEPGMLAVIVVILRI